MRRIVSSEAGALMLEALISTTLLLITIAAALESLRAAMRLTSPATRQIRGLTTSPERCSALTRVTTDTIYLCSCGESPCIQVRQ